MKKESFVLHKSFWQPIKSLTNDALGRLFRLLYEWQTNDSGSQIVADDDIEMPFQFFVNQFMIDERKYLATCEKNKQNATKRWSNKDAVGCGRIRTDAIDADKIRKEKIRDYIMGDDVTNPPSKTKKFAKPSIDEIRQYCLNRNNSVDADKFLSFYESNGWKVGKNPMKDWKAAIRTWERSSYNQSNSSQPQRKGKILTAKELI